jgi:hypothetical protein
MGKYFLFLVIATLTISYILSYIAIWNYTYDEVNGNGYYSYHANKKFFHSQCMQSIFPSILENPLDSLIENSRTMLAAFGSFKYSPANR